jgi:glycosyltransferase involved in cell wall biosynthesis
VSTLVVPEISVVIPCLNEEQNAVPIAAAVIAVLEKKNVTFDIIFIDNDSRDRTVEVIKGLCRQDPRIKLIVNSRNFGQMRSPVHAVYVASGSAVIGMSADFQDPPELLGEFIDRWRAGVDIVLGVRENDKSSFMLTAAREFSYTVANLVGDYPIVRNCTGFGLYDRRVVDALRQIREPEPFFRGLLVETGYKIETLAYSRPLRERGRSNNNFFTLLDFAISSLTSSSKRILRLPFFIGGVAALGSAMCIVAFIVQFALGQTNWFWLVAFAVQLQLAILFGALGLIGDQIRLIAERTRNVPLVFERERVNFPADY